MVHSATRRCLRIPSWSLVSKSFNSLLPMKTVPKARQRSSLSSLPIHFRSFSCKFSMLGLVGNCSWIPMCFQRTDCPINGRGPLMKMASMSLFLAPCYTSTRVAHETVTRSSKESTFRSSKNRLIGMDCLSIHGTLVMQRQLYTIQCLGIPMNDQDCTP